MEDSTVVLDDRDLLYPRPAQSLEDLEQPRLENSENDYTATKHTSFRTDPLFVRITQLRAPVRRFKMLQQFEGVVTRVESDSFWADLYDITVSSRPMEVVEIDLEQLCDDDIPILQPGSVFYWCIGYNFSPAGGKQLVSEFRVQRTPLWTQRRLDEANGKADLRRDFLNGDDEVESTSG